jgi:thioredoxin 1
MTRLLQGSGPPAGRHGPLAYLFGLHRLPAYPYFAVFANRIRIAEGEIMAFDNDYGKPEPARQEVDQMPGPVLLEFGTGWCGYCQAIQGPLEALLASFPHVRHIKVEDGKGRPLGRSFGIKLWPNLVFLCDGKVSMQLARPQPEEIRQGLESITRHPGRDQQSAADETRSKP